MLCKNDKNKKSRILKNLKPLPLSLQPLSSPNLIGSFQSQTKIKRCNSLRSRSKPFTRKNKMEKRKIKKGLSDGDFTNFLQVWKYVFICSMAQILPEEMNVQQKMTHLTIVMCTKCSQLHRTLSMAFLIELSLSENFKIN